jgi:single-strand DNA-binding protein
MNRVELIGNLGQAGELKHTNDGSKSFCRFSVAVNESYKDKNGEKKETTTWVNVVLWGRQAETVAPMLTKGARVFIDGKLRATKWNDKETGKEVKSFEVHANSVNVLKEFSRGDSKSEDSSSED